MLIAAVRSVLTYVLVSLYVALVAPPGILLAALFRWKSLLYFFGHTGVRLALFLSGIFPDHAAFFEARSKTMFSTGRTLRDYEQQGRRFYGLAAATTDQARWKPAFETLSSKFILARRALNTLGDRYLKSHRASYFRVPGAS